MVSLWPWKADTSSPASFEKALSKLSSQITAATLSLETTRSRARRVKALWTLYTTVTYLLYTLIIALVLGPRKWAIPHYAGLVGTPLVVYLVRRGITVIFDWRISQLEAHIEALQKQRDTKIVDLKKATRYDSTQELLQKYGGAGKPTPSKSQQQLNQQTQQGTKRKITPTPNPPRTGLPPPPTANIPGRIATPALSTPQRPNSDTTSPRPARPESPPPVTAFVDSPENIVVNEPGFAPNAFPNSPQQARPEYEQSPKWYDRILDLLLGEDETLAKNRVVLICSSCRLVNGQAPPGVRSLEEVGKWKCGGCGAWNGVQSDAAHVVKEMHQKLQDESVEGQATVSKGLPRESKHTQADDIVDDESKTIEFEDHTLGSTKEIPDSEEDVDDEDEDIRPADDGDDGNKLSERRVTRSVNKQNAKKRR